MKILVCLCLLCCLFAPINTWAQDTATHKQYIMLLEKGHTKYRYGVGDLIIYRTVGDNMKFEGYISYLDPKLIKIMAEDNIEVQLPIAEIERFYVKPHDNKSWATLAGIGSVVFPLAGVAYVLLDGLNNNRFNETLKDRNTQIIAGSLIGSGLLLRYLLRQRAVIPGKRGYKLSVGQVDGFIYRPNIKGVDY